jgi:heme exporter protein D
MYVFCYFGLLLAVFMLGMMQGEERSNQKVQQEVARQVQRQLRQRQIPVNRWDSQDEAR